MSRTLFRIPKMFTEQEMTRIDPRLPDDYHQRFNEFWKYVEERLYGARHKIRKIYLESTGVTGKRQLDMLKMSNPRQHGIVKTLLDSGSELVQAEDPELVLETMSWMQKMQEMISSGIAEDGSSKIQTIGEFLQESMKERNDFVARRVDETLGDEEVGVLFMDMSRELDLKRDIRMITVCPFRPLDYLNSWLAGLRARKGTSVEEEE